LQRKLKTILNNLVNHMVIKVAGDNIKLFRPLQEDKDYGATHVKV
jgi:hypothetical protein